MLHFSFICRHTASIMSTSQPTHLPVASFQVNGGYGSAAKPNLTSAFAFATQENSVKIAIEKTLRRAPMTHVLRDLTP